MNTLSVLAIALQGIGYSAALVAAQGLLAADIIAPLTPSGFGSCVGRTADQSLRPATTSNNRVSQAAGTRPVASTDTRATQVSTTRSTANGDSRAAQVLTTRSATVHAVRSNIQSSRR